MSGQTHFIIFFQRLMAKPIEVRTMASKGCSRSHFHNTGCPPGHVLTSIALVQQMRRGIEPRLLNYFVHSVSLNTQGSKALVYQWACYAESTRFL